MSQSELLIKVVAALDRADAAYMLSGSFASSIHGDPRLTHDIDLVVALNPLGIDSLTADFSEPDYFLDPLSIRSAIASKGQFNLLDLNSGDKVDFWMLTPDAFDQSRFSRKYLEDFEGIQVFVSTPEDTIIMKLRWAEMSGGSQKQMADARSVYELQLDTLDLAYIERWIVELKLNHLWQEIKQAP